MELTTKSEAMAWFSKHGVKEFNDAKPKELPDITDITVGGDDHFIELILHMPDTPNGPMIAPIRLALPFHDSALKAMIGSMLKRIAAEMDKGTELWIVGQMQGEWKTPEDGCTVWEFQGVFDSEEKAVAACRDENYWVARVVLNKELPHESAEFDRAYFPKRGEASE